MDGKNKMRVFILPLVMVLSYFSLEGATRLEIKIVNCSSEQSVYNQWVKILDDEGGRIEFLITKENKGIKKIQPGNYVIEYFSRFGRREVERVYISKGKRKKVQLCSDKFTSELEPIKRIAIIDSLRSGESYQIIYDTRGCFHQVGDSLELFKIENAYFLKCQENWVQLSEQEIALIRDFEYRLWNIQLANGGCTTTDIYGIRYKGRYILVSMDNSCGWNGFSGLKRALEERIACLQQCAE